MKVFRRSLLVLSLLSPLALSGCGEGWEMQPYTEKVPYTMERTAGSGVAYVRASMAPAKGPALKVEAEEPVKVMKSESIEKDSPPPAAVEAEKDTEIVKEADKIFTSRQKK